MEIDFSKPKQISEVSSAEHVQSVLPVDVTQSSEEDMQRFVQKLVSNTKTVAHLNAAPDFSDQFVHVPASEPNVPKRPPDLYSDCN